MQTIIDLWTGMEMRRRALLIGGVAGVVTVLFLLVRLASAPSFALLYSGLDAAAAGDVISALETRGVDYQVRGDAIFVEESQRDSLRMGLAGEGLPALGAAGYELLDSLSGFGTTAQMFDAAYWRAKEGELARTIAASPRIRTARVHLATPSNDPFAPEQEPSAAVSLRPASGGISSGHAQALRYLVASAVPGLLPDNVTIVDSDSGRVLATDGADSAAGDASGLSETLRRNVERLLTARVGPGNAVVEVNVDLETAHQTVVERIIDPNSRVVIGTETEQSSNQSRGAGDSAVTVASNLPSGAAATGAGTSAQATDSRERVTYDISETQRETESGPGAVRRISVAVMVNTVPLVDADGLLSQQPRSAEELQSLRDLVRSAVGFDADRGDVVTLESLEFEPVPELGESGPANGSVLSRLDLMRLAPVMGLVAVALAMAFGVVRPALRQGPPEFDPLQVDAAGARAAPMLAMSPPQDEDAAPEPTAPAPSEVASLPSPVGREDLPGEVGTSDPVARLRRLIEEREQETVEILRSWMEEDEELT